MYGFCSGNLPYRILYSLSRTSCSECSLRAALRVFDHGLVMVCQPSFGLNKIILSLQVADGIYEELDAQDEKLNLGITLTPAMSSDLITSYSSISLPVTSSSSSKSKQEDSTSAENVEVRFDF